MQATGLTARALSCRKGDRLLFGSLDLRLDAGEAMLLVGPNGIGKTSLLRMLAGLLAPSPNLLPSPPGARIGGIAWQGNVAYLDERLALDLHLPLGKALDFWRLLDRGQAGLERIGLAGLIDVPVRYLSTGQKKRAGLARLLGQSADHWLLDEPLNGLDADGAALVEQLIAEQRAAGGVVVVASHQAIAMPQAQRLDLRDHPA